MQVFLDSNIYLNYLSGTADSEAFPKLLKLVEEKNVSSIITQQVIDEYFRNYTFIKNEKIKQITSKKDLDLSSIKYTTLKSFTAEFKKIKSQFERNIANQKKNIKKERLIFKERENNIEKLFKKSHLIEETEEILKKAERRFLKGNPPRKKKERNDSFGDAINWESLILLNINKRPKDNIVIISCDADYTEELYGEIKLNSLLLKEWKAISRKKIKILLTIGEFINVFSKKEVIKKKVIKTEKANIMEEALIRRSQHLGQIKDYTRAVISKLSPREQKILEMRFGLIDGVPHTLNEVGQEFEVSGQRIRQIESRALEKIRKFREFDDIITDF
jgi:RNA polymerase sigma factor (sigma-70 family)